MGLGGRGGAGLGRMETFLQDERSEEKLALAQTGGGRMCPWRNHADGLEARESGREG